MTVEVQITAAQYAAAAGVSPDALEEVCSAQAVLLADGTCAIAQGVYLVTDGDLSAREGGHVITALRPDGTLATTHLPPDVAPAMKSTVSIAALAGGLLVHVYRRFGPAAEAKVYHLSWDGTAWGTPSEWRLTRHLPEAQARRGFTVAVEAGARGFGSETVACFQIHTTTGDETTATGAFAFLAVDADAKTAEWRVSPNEEGARPSAGLLGRMFGAKSSPHPLAPLENDSFATLEGWNIPRWSHQDRHVPVTEAALVDGTVIIHSPGPGASLKYGHRGDIISEVGTGGTEQRRIRTEDFVNHPEGNRKHGRRATCVNGGRHWVLSSTYKATDPLKGKMVMVASHDGAERVLTLPKDVAKNNWHDRNPIEADATRAIYGMVQGDDITHRFWIVPHGA